MSAFTTTTIAACVALAAVEAARLLGIEVPRTAAMLTASGTAVLAMTVAVRHVAFVWRGPVIVSFRRRDGMLCDANEAAVVRAAAQLRGTMGGAGHVHPHRLMLTAGAWAAASVQALVLVGPDRGLTRFVPLTAVIVAGALAAQFPAVPFYYREAAGGCVVAFPPGACALLLGAAALQPVRPVELGAFRLRAGEALDGRVAAEPEGDGAPGRNADRPDVPES